LIGQQRSIGNLSPYIQARCGTYSVALQSLKDLGSLTYGRFLKVFRQMAGLLGRVIGLSQGLYLHRTTQHRNTRTHIHALSGIQTHDPSVRAIKTHAPDRAATVTGSVWDYKH
jgi:hypothetical protein